ncbi:cob(I)yrinic acid a,c-diamide adenosyltransferase [Exiguobacterium aurantiacum]|uniref:Corrinoid adenosyltransferase n=1 Tax=Exiguobacterium aurantiacum TaxID=33987 RepID=A0A377FT90_9BACL|nr:cob(I)yrinic acid a,c-diamide adenosyltransferase [Exiguobacterium aurantiacum]STO07968.1 Cob(I)yrinic acid a,c-diamide adenosyltransferase [Exiguobacterium aurantiacum]
MRLYTRGGDQGETSLIGGRVSKVHPQIEAMGLLDELNSHIGLALAHQTDETLRTQLTKIQHDLFDLGSELMHQNEPPKQVDLVIVTELETWIDELEPNCPPLRRFILPGGSVAAASLHVARTVCRRVERELVEIEAATRQLPYFNRLSDYLFTAARYANVKAGVPDQEYARGADVFKQKKKKE